MADATRLEFDQYYHIFNRGNNSETVFRQERNYHFFMELYTKHLYPVVDTFAYCLLPNHFHFLIKIKSEEVIVRSLKKNNMGKPTDQVEKRKNPHKLPSQIFGNLFNAYTKSYNKVYQRTGSLFEKPFHRKLVKNTEYFQQLILYIHYNPQKHGLIDDFCLWPFSSYLALTSNQPTRLSRDQVMEYFGGLETFISLHSDYNLINIKEEFYNSKDF